MTVNTTRTRLGAGLMGVVGTLSLSLAMLAPPAAAQSTGPTEPIPIGGNGSTISGVTLNGQATTYVLVEPSATVDVSATLTLGSGVNSGWIYWAGYGWAGASSPSACSNGTGGVGSTDTTSFTVTAPSAPGEYQILAALAPDPCPWYQGPTVAVVEVAGGTTSSLCWLAERYSTDPAVAAGLCDKLAAAQAASDRGQPNVAANIMRAFDNLVNAQTGKALTADQAATLIADAANLP